MGFKKLNTAGRPPRALWGRLALVAFDEPLGLKRAERWARCCLESSFVRALANAVGQLEAVPRAQDEEASFRREGNR